MTLAVDTETTGLNPWTGARPFAVSAYDGTQSWWWEWRVNPETRKPLIPVKDKRAIRELLSDSSEPKVFFNAAFDLLMLEAIGIQVAGKIEEVSFKARAVNNLLPSYKLKALSDLYFSESALKAIKRADPDLADYLRGLRSTDEQALHKATIKARRVARKLGWNCADDSQADYWIAGNLWRICPEIAREADIPKDACKTYGIKDAERTWWLNELFDHALETIDVEEAEKYDVQQDARGTYQRECALLPTSIEMQRKGVCIDLKRMHALQAHCEAEKADALKELQTTAKELVGITDFNPNSPKQVGELLFSKKGAGLPSLGTTDSGQPKTGAEFIIPFKSHPLVRQLLRFRSNEKALTTFFDKYDALCEPLPGYPDLAILHPVFHQWGALTGRYTCNSPNLQQVSDPNTTNSRAPEFMVNVRQVFVPRPGTVWYCPDYDQLEVIIFADIAGEPTMLEAIRNGDDIHTATANKVWGGEGNPRSFNAVQRVLELAKDRHATDQKRINELLQQFEWDICAIESEFKLKVWRKLGKTVTFTKIFGGGVNALMSWIGCTQKEGYALLNDYDSSFPEMTEKMDEIIARGRAQGFVVNPFGRRLQIDRWYAYRAVNYMVQSAAADLMKNGMRNCAAYLKDIGLDAYIAMTIHDEIVFEFARRHAFKSVLRKLCALMADHGGVFTVDTPVSMERVTKTWAEKTKVDLTVA